MQPRPAGELTVGIPNLEFSPYFYAIGDNLPPNLSKLRLQFESKIVIFFSDPVAGVILNLPPTALPRPLLKPDPSSQTRPRSRVRPLVA